MIYAYFHLILIQFSSEELITFWVNQYLIN